MPKNQPLCPFCFPRSHHVFDFCDHSLILLKLLYGSWFNPLLTSPTYPQAHTHARAHIHTHILSFSFPQCCFNNAPPTPPLDTACIDCVPREGLVFYITSDILLDPPVAPVSVSGSWMFSTQLPCLLSPLPLEGCWHCFVSTASTMFKPVLSH